VTAWRQNLHGCSRQFHTAIEPQWIADDGNCSQTMLIFPISIHSRKQGLFKYVLVFPRRPYVALHVSPSEILAVTWHSESRAAT
jgi:hypothetical protein